MCLTCTLYIPSDPISEAPVPKLLRRTTTVLRKAKDIASDVISSESRWAKAPAPEKRATPLAGGSRLSRRETKRPEVIMKTSEALLSTAGRVEERTHELLRTSEAGREYRTCCSGCADKVSERTNHKTLPPLSYTSSNASTPSTSSDSQGPRDSGVALPAFRPSPTRAASTRWPTFRDHRTNSEERIPAYNVAARDEWLNKIDNAVINARVRRALERWEQGARQKEIDREIEGRLDELERQREENWVGGGKRRRYERPRVEDVDEFEFEYKYGVEYGEPLERSWRDV